MKIITFTILNVQIITVLLLERVVSGIVNKAFEEIGGLGRPLLPLCRPARLRLATVNRY